MWSRTEYGIGDRIPVSGWGPFTVERIREAIGASTKYDGYFGKRKRYGRTLQAVNTHLVPAGAMTHFEDKVLRMMSLTSAATRFIEGLYVVDSRPDLRIVVFDQEPDDIADVPLSDFLRLSAPHRARLAWYVAHATFSALAEIHQEGFTHDEITLDTILLQPLERPRRAGLATLGAQALEFVGIRSKTPSFDDHVEPLISLRGFGLDRLLGNRPLDEGHAAPERRAGSVACPASDVYSVGVVLHQLLSGRHLPPGRPPEPLNAASHAAPRFVAELVSRALDPSPASRPAQAADWAQAFQEAFLSEPARFPWVGPIIFRFPELE